MIGAGGGKAPLFVYEQWTDEIRGMLIVCCVQGHSNIPRGIGVVNTSEMSLLCDHFRGSESNILSMTGCITSRMGEC